MTIPEGGGVRFQALLTWGQCALFLSKNVLLFPELPLYFSEFPFNLLEVPFCFPGVSFYFSKMPYCFPELPFSFPGVPSFYLLYIFQECFFSSRFYLTFSSSCSELLREIIFVLLFCFPFVQPMMPCVLKFLHVKTLCLQQISNICFLYLGKVN